MTVTIRTFAFSFLACVSMLATANASTTKYFRSIRMDGHHQFYFKKELHGADTSSCNCYRASYDDQGRLVGWAYISAGELQQDPDFEIARCEIAYDGLFTVYRFYDRHGNRDDNADGHYGEKFKIDTKMKNGGLYPYDRHDNILNSDNKGVYRYGWIVDDSGYILKEMNLNDDGIRIARNDGVFETQYTYENGLMKDMSYYDKDGKLISVGGATRRFTYDADGNVTTVLFLDTKGGPLEDSGRAAKVDMGYDEWGYENMKTLYDAFGSLIQIKKWVQDERGNVIEERTFGPDEDLSSHDPIMQWSYDAKNYRTDLYKRDKKGRIRVHLHYVYDNKGNLQEETCTDSLNKAIVDDDSYSTRKFTYDDNSHQTSEIYYGPDGNPVGREQDSVAFIYKKYNSAGLITEVKYLDSNKNMHESSDYGVAMLTFAYDDDGDLKEVHGFDANGKEKQGGQ